MKRPNTNLSPFHGKPRTEQHLDKDGGLSFSIRPRELTPIRARIADTLAPLTAIWAAWEGLVIVESLPMPPDWMYWAVIGGPILALPLLKRAYRWLLKRRWEMVMTQEQFKFRTWRGWRSFDRRLPHKFSLLLHDKAQLEKERIEQDLRRGKTNGKTYSQLRYYGDAFHISYEYLGQRNDIATVFIQKNAVAVVARLKACDEVMDAQDKMGDGTALTPKDQWDDQTGDIEE